jgi:hypothetical protein
MILKAHFFHFLGLGLICCGVSMLLCPKDIKTPAWDRAFVFYGGLCIGLSAKFVVDKKG